MAEQTKKAVETDDLDEVTGPPPGMQKAASLDLNSLGEFGRLLAAAITQGMAASAPPRKITIGEYIRRGSHSPFHPNKTSSKLRRECYQNGFRMVETTLHDREIDLLNQITHSGRYIDRLVEVVVDDSSADEVVYIRFNNKREAQLELKGKCRDFTDMLTQIVEAQKQEDADADERNEKKSENRRRFGEGKATREARERAGV